VTRFTRFACFDWSGAALARPPGIALAIADAAGAPVVVAPDGGWSRHAVLSWLRDLAIRGEDMLVGFDLSPALPFADAGAYFPGWPESPADARALWAMIDDRAADDPHLGVAGVLADPVIAAYFRQHGGRQGTRFGDAGRGRLRVTEERCRAMGFTPSSVFNLVGAAQIGKSGLTGMRLLHHLRGAIPFWPIDPLPDRGPVLVEIYTSLAARAAGLPPGRSKIREPAALDAALARLGSPPAAAVRLNDHIADALLTAAWLRRHADDPALWSPPGLAAVAATEGWTFGVR
jgi:hypothetical protein